MKISEIIKKVFGGIKAFIISHKITSAVIISAVATIVAVSLILAISFSAPKAENTVAGNEASKETVVSSEESVSSEETVSSEAVPSSVPSQAVVSSKPAAVKPSVSTPTPVNTDFKYNASMSPDNNVFLDALAYTGYKVDKERASGRMWGSYGNYVRCSQKKGFGWLSNITYGGGTTGYEVDSAGKPDIKCFEKGGLVCATYETYVYFNYLPNVAGIDTSSLTRPNRSYSANDWYVAAKDWVNKGYSKYISFTANDGGSINNDIKFTEAEDIPIGSIICLQDWYNRNGYCSHVCIYAGRVNGYHWVTHVGNENGPEFCAIERMNRKPHPQWPLAIITTPTNIRFAPTLEVTVRDEEGNPMQGVKITVKSKAGNTVIDLGSTDENGKVKKDGLNYGEYIVEQTVPDGYECEADSVTVKLNTNNNSLNTVKFVNAKKVIIESSELSSVSDPEYN